MIRADWKRGGADRTSKTWIEHALGVALAQFLESAKLVWDVAGSMRAAAVAAPGGADSFRGYYKAVRGHWRSEFALRDGLGGPGIRGIRVALAYGLAHHVGPHLSAALRGTHVSIEEEDTTCLTAFSECAEEFYVALFRPAVEAGAVVEGRARMFCVFLSVAILTMLTRGNVHPFHGAAGLRASPYVRPGTSSQHAPCDARATRAQVR